MRAATKLTMMPANNHSVKDGDNVGGGRLPGGFNKENALVLAAETVTALVSDNANGGDGGVAVVGGAFEDAVVRAGASGAGASGVGTMTMGGGSNYADPVGPLGSPWRIRHGNHSCSRREVMTRVDGFAATHSDGTARLCGKEVQNEPRLRETTQY